MSCAPAGDRDADPPPHDEDDAFAVILADDRVPIDRLVVRARRRSLDPAALPLVEIIRQYLDFIAEKHRLGVAVKSDYLVASAWLVYLKSRALIAPILDPPDPDDHPLGDAWRDYAGRRLDAWRRAARALFARPQRDRDIFARGAPEIVAVAERRRTEHNLGALIADVIAVRKRRNAVPPAPPADRGPSVLDARAWLAAGGLRPGVWRRFDALARRFADDLGEPATSFRTVGVLFVSTLDLVRDGRVEARQPHPDAPLRLRLNGKPENDATSPGRRS